MRPIFLRVYPKTENHLGYTLTIFLIYFRLYLKMVMYHKGKEIMTVRELVKQCGGIVAFCREINAPISTVYNWIYKDKVPAWRIMAIRDLTISKNIIIADDFWATVSEKTSKGAK